MIKHYIVYTKAVLPQPDAAHLVWATNSANAAANLGYPSILVHLAPKEHSLNPWQWLFPFQPRTPEASLVNFYSLQEKVKFAGLPIPGLFDRWAGKWTNSSTLVCKYYFPIHIRPHTKIVHSRDWNFIKAAIKQGVPVIYEHHHYADRRFDPEIVGNPLFQIAITVSEPIREDMIQRGIPSEKIIKLHSGFNQSFLVRQPENAATWRKKLLSDGRQYMILYSGGLYRFKGIDLLIDVAKELSQIQFVFAGGNESQVTAYRQLANEKQVKNVTFLGYIQHEQLSSLLQAADVLAHPHCSGKAATFTSPLKLFDYMASGTPIVATEIPPLMEFKSSNAIAGWCEPDNPTQFAQCLQQVLASHPRKLEGYTDNIDFVRQFSWENRIAKILSHVDEAMRPQMLTN